MSKERKTENIYHFYIAILIYLILLPEVLRQRLRKKVTNAVMLPFRKVTAAP